VDYNVSWPAVGFEPVNYVVLDNTKNYHPIFQFGIWFLGYNVANVGASISQATFYDAGDDVGNSVFTAQVPANDTRSLWLGPEGVLFQGGLTVDTQSITIYATVLFRRVATFYDEGEPEVTTDDE
jgi:hypothetical protein